MFGDIINNGRQMKINGYLNCYVIGQGELSREVITNPLELKSVAEHFEQHANRHLMNVRTGHVGELVQAWGISEEDQDEPRHFPCCCFSTAFFCFSLITSASLRS